MFFHLFEEITFTNHIEKSLNNFQFKISELIFLNLSIISKHPVIIVNQIVTYVEVRKSKSHTVTFDKITILRKSLLKLVLDVQNALKYAMH